ncbi:hypothetical protein [Dinghuibacter silviterrae]|uniref:Uncharacterized protein n=1 Tax=Dinghuibacter silviterrae TaxID=1539049 RepID=A0A4R8DUM5_9BACT|nr:hypothetical protein [Dinghuibacter silviterrae]TDX02092.1 hypothetical protein EDB95_3142 [Dinghuibacter silviterrae]
MKKIYQIAFLAVAVLLLTSATPAHKQILVNVYAANGINWPGTLNIVGGLDEGFPPTSYTYMGQIAAGTYTVTLSISGPLVSRTYMLTGEPTQVSSSGSVTWTNVSITGTTVASVYVN